MLVIRRGYRKQYVIVGSGLFESIPKFLLKLLTSNATKQLASTAVDVVRSTLTSTLQSAAKSAATDSSKRLIEKRLRRYLHLNRKTIAKYSSGQKSVQIQDLVKRLNGSGMKIV